MGRMGLMGLMGRMGQMGLMGLMGQMGLMGLMGRMGLMGLMGQMGFMRVREPCADAQGTVADGGEEWEQREGMRGNEREWEGMGGMGAMGWMLFVGWWGDLGSPFCVGFV